MGESTDVSDPALAAFGFITVIEHEQFGLVGGYLILNPAGRPLEFHCTAPVRPSRAQQILFGPTLAPYLHGEQIAQAMINKSGITPLVVWSDQAPVLAVRGFVSTPVALVITDHRVTDEARQHFEQVVEFPIGRHQIAVVGSHLADRDRIVEHAAELAAIDLLEPFGRIRDAIEEAHRAAAVNRQAA